MTALSALGQTAIAQSADPPAVDTFFGDRDLVYLALLVTRARLYTLSDRIYKSKPSDSLPSTYFEPRIEDIVIERSVSLAPETQSDGSNKAEVTLHNSDGFFDDALTKEDVDGRKFQVLVGEPDWSFDDFRLVYEGEILKLSSSGDGRTVGVDVRDFSYRLSLPLNDRFENEFNNVTVDDGKRGAWAQITYGTNSYIRPQLINAGKQIYQVASNPSFTDSSGFFIFDVYIDGDDNVYTDAGTSSDLDSASLASNEYKADKDYTMVRLGSAPDGEVHLNVTGIQGDETLQDSDELCLLAKKAVENAGIAASHINDASFVSLQKEWQNESTTNVYNFNASPIHRGGLNSQNQPLSAKDVLKWTINKAGSYWYISRDNKINVKRLIEPVRANYSVILDETNILTIRKVNLPDSLEPPNKKRTVGHTKVWGGPPSSISTAASDTVKAQLSFEHLETSFKDASVPNSHPLASAPETSVAPLEDDFVAPYIVARHLMKMHGVKRNLYEIDVDARGLGIEMGETARVSYGRFNLSHDYFLVFPVRESSRERRVTLLAWG